MYTQYMPNVNSIYETSLDTFGAKIVWFDHLFHPKVQKKCTEKFIVCLKNLCICENDRFQNSVGRCLRLGYFSTMSMKHLVSVIDTICIFEYFLNLSIRFKNILNHSMFVWTKGQLCWDVAKKRKSEKENDLTIFTCGHA